MPRSHSDLFWCDTDLPNKEISILTINDRIFCERHTNLELSQFRLGLLMRALIVS